MIRQGKLRYLLHPGQHAGSSLCWPYAPWYPSAHYRATSIFVHMHYWLHFFTVEHSQVRHRHGEQQDRMFPWQELHVVLSPRRSWDWETGSTYSKCHHFRGRYLQRYRTEWWYIGWWQGNPGQQRPRSAASLWAAQGVLIRIWWGLHLLWGCCRRLHPDLHRRQRLLDHGV